MPRGNANSSGDIFPSRGRIVIVGLGNIGSALADHLARMNLAEVTLVDPGEFDQAKDLHHHFIERSALGRAKVEVVAERMRQIDGRLRVRAIRRRVQDVPPGMLRCDVLLAALDSRVARAYVNRACLRLGQKWIDSGVEPAQSLVRIQCFTGKTGDVCAECNWSDSDYSAMETRFPCRMEQAAATNSPGFLGGLAASLQANELQKILDGNRADALFGRQLVYSAAAHRLYVSKISLNPACRAEHRKMKPRPTGRSPEKLTLRQALRLGPRIAVGGETVLRVGEQGFVRSLQCRRCGATRNHLLRLEGRLTPTLRRCRKCESDEMIATGFSILEDLGVAILKNNGAARSLDQPMSAIGFENGDVFELERGSIRTPFEFALRSPGAIQCDRSAPGRGKMAARR